MNIHENSLFLYPSDALKKNIIDEQYSEEAECMHKNGIPTAMISLENMEHGLKNITPLISHECKIIYRGWMLSAEKYNNLVEILKKHNLTPFISLDNYLSTHYLPNWYSLISDLTPETKIFNVDDNLPLELSRLGWKKYFIKDYVKSLKTSVGSFIDDPGEITKVMNEMKKFRGIIEGGICVRRVENFKLNSEKRYFVINSHPFGPEKEVKIPDIVYQCARRIKSQFFSIDIAEREDQQLRVIEIGDGQVSDLVGWSVERFSDIWLQQIIK